MTLPRFRRWKAIGKKCSETILGRIANQRAYYAARESGCSFAVTCYTTRVGKRFYSDFNFLGPRDKLRPRKYDKPEEGAGRKLRYRVIVTPKLP